MKASAPPQARRRRGPSLVVLALVVCSLLVPVAFLFFFSAGNWLCFFCFNDLFLGSGLVRFRLILDGVDSDSLKPLFWSTLFFSSADLCSRQTVRMIEWNGIFQEQFDCEVCDSSFCKISDPRSSKKKCETGF